MEIYFSFVNIIGGVYRMKGGMFILIAEKQ